MSRYAAERIEFPELFDGAFVKVVTPTLLPWGTQKRLQAVRQRLSKVLEGVADGSITDEDVTVDQLEELQDQMASVVAGLIVEWNIPPIGGEEPLALPVTVEQLDRVPGTVVERISEWVRQARPTETTPTSEGSEQPSSTAVEPGTSTTSSSASSETQD